MRRDPGSRETAERELRAAFETLRRETRESGGAPDFPAMMAEVRARLDHEAIEVVRPRAGREGRPGGTVGPRSPWLRWAPLAAAAALAALLLVARPPGAPDADAELERLVSDYRSLAGAGAWRSPTASLLDLPGVDLGAVPTFGRGLPGGGLPLHDPRRGRTP